ncbi:MAG: hypothetical protein WDO74_36345 [Pseudomonadota bacterium]
MALTSSVDGALGSFLPGGGAFGRSGIASIRARLDGRGQERTEQVHRPARLDAALSENRHERSNRRSRDFVDVLVAELVEKTLAEDPLVTLPSPWPKLRPEQGLEGLFKEHAKRWRIRPELESSGRVRDLHQPPRFGLRTRSRLNASILPVTLLASVFVSKSKINDQAGLAIPLPFLNTVTQLSHGFRSVGACSCVTRRSIA